MKKILVLIISLTLVLVLTGCKKNYDEKEIIKDIEKTAEGVEHKEETLVVSYNDSDAITSLYKESQKTNRSFWDGIFGGLVTSKDMAVNEAVADVSLSPNQQEGGETSSTTLRIEGIDEADYLKNDDHYIYYSTYNYYATSELVVLDTVDDSYQTYNINGYICGMFLNQYGLIVLASTGTYRYFYSNFKIFVFDNTNPMKMQIKEEIDLGNYRFNDARFIDNKLYVMGSLMIIDDNQYVEPEIKINDDKKTIDVANINVIKNANYYSNYAYTIFSLDFEEDMNLNFKSLYGFNGEFLLTKDNLYLYETLSALFFGQEASGTRIYRMSLNDLCIKGAVMQKGYINDVFSIDEYDGVLRVATTYTEYNEHTTHYENYLATYSIKGDEFKNLDSISFAEDEKIYSATFQGTKAYIVTYLYIDPLFEFDLSNPEDIKYLRSLKSPGVSDYLDYINDDFILGIGRITEEKEMGNWQYATSSGIKLSLFSLDNQDMVEEDTYKFDYDYSYTDATYDYHKLIKLKDSLSYYMPLNAYNYQRETNEEDFHGIVGFQVDLEARKIIILGQIKGDYNSRAVVVNGKLYVLSRDSLQMSIAGNIINDVKKIK